MRGSNAAYWCAAALTVAVLGWLLLPRPHNVEHYSHPAFEQALPEFIPRNYVEIKSQQQAGQKVWITSHPVTAVSLRLFPPAAPDPLPYLIVREDAVGQPGQELGRSASAEIHDNTLTFSLSEPVPVQDSWVWVVIENAAPQSIYVVREIDSASYPEGQLRINGPDAFREHNGVIAFALAGPQWLWVQPRSGVLVAAGLLCGWVLYASMAVPRCNTVQ